MTDTPLVFPMPAQTADAAPFLAPDGTLLPRVARFVTWLDTDPKYAQLAAAIRRGSFTDALTLGYTDAVTAWRTDLARRG